MALFALWQALVARWDRLREFFRSSIDGTPASNGTGLRRCTAAFTTGC